MDALTVEQGRNLATGLVKAVQGSLAGYSAVFTARKGVFTVTMKPAEGAPKRKRGEVESESKSSAAAKKKAKAPAKKATKKAAKKAAKKGSDNGCAARCFREKVQLKNLPNCRHRVCGRCLPNLDRCPMCRADFDGAPAAKSRGGRRRGGRTYYIDFDTDDSDSFDSGSSSGSDCDCSDCESSDFDFSD